MKIYACSVAAVKTKCDVYYTKTEYVHCAYAIQANNKQEAIGKTYDVMMDIYKPDDGYSNHSVSVVLVPGEWE